MGQRVERRRTKAVRSAVFWGGLASKFVELEFMAIFCGCVNGFLTCALFGCVKLKGFAGEGFHFWLCGAIFDHFAYAYAYAYDLYRSPHTHATHTHTHTKHNAFFVI